MKLNDKILTVLVTLLLALGGWMLRVQSSVDVNAQQLKASTELTSVMKSNQEDLKEILHKLDITLTQFKGEFVSRTEFNQYNSELSKLHDAFIELKFKVNNIKNP